MELPPGFRFHPTDEELITHYLNHKVLDSSFSARAIGEVDLNKCEPWDLPCKAKMGEKEWYFFSARDRKYPTGLRTNRATGAGYWKATGKDRDIYRGKALVGMKKTLVFYTGRAPKGEKTNWVMHEFRLEGKYSVYNLPKTAKSEWVICRVMKKTSGGKRTHMPGLVPLTESSPCSGAGEAEEKLEEDIINDGYTTTNNTEASLLIFTKPPPSVHETIYVPNVQYQDSILMQEQSIQRLLYENNNNNVNGQSWNMKTTMRFKEELLQETGDLNCLWNY